MSLSSISWVCSCSKSRVLTATCIILFNCFRTSLLYLHNYAGLTLHLLSCKYLYDHHLSLHHMCFCRSDYHHITFMIVYKPQCSMCEAFLFTVVVCSFRATVGRSASDGEVHSVDGSLRSEEGRRSAAQQHRHHAHPALYQLHRPHQQPNSWSVHI